MRNSDEVDRNKKILMKKPSSGNKKFDKDDAEGADRTGDARDYSKAYLIVNNKIFTIRELIQYVN